MRWGGMGILRFWTRVADDVAGLVVEGGKRGRPSGSMVVVISVSVSAVDLVGGKGVDDGGGGGGGGGGDVSGTDAVKGSVVMRRSSSSGRGMVSATSRMCSSGRGRSAVGAGMLRYHRSLG